MSHTIDRPPTGSVTITLQEPQNPAPVHGPPPEVISLRLAPRRKKKVSWQPGTVDNEFLNKKSSKKCCIFHKNKSFDEDASDDEDDCGDGKRPQDQGKGKAPCNSGARGHDGEGSSSHCCSHSH